MAAPLRDPKTVKVRKRIIVEPKDIDLELLHDVAKLHATRKEIADFFRISESVLSEDPFHSVIIKAQDETKQRLKSKALKRALDEDSDVMLKFCLKNYCGWTDNPQQTLQIESTTNQNGFTISVIPTKPDA